MLSRGLATTTALAAKNAKVYIAARSRKKAEKAMKRIKENQKDAKIEVIEMDLADLESVKKGAEEFLRYVPVFFHFVRNLNAESEFMSRGESKLHILINNAGVSLFLFLPLKQGC
jgi:NAD(P)-dependent dehydrogenase (short-subunit alcohol dehydrogenase family)